MFGLCRVWVPAAFVPIRCNGVSERAGYSMNELEQLSHDVRGFATEVRQLGYSSVAGGHENLFIELSERMVRYVDQADWRSR